MKFLDRIGREVFYKERNEINQRNGEGDFIKLKDGTVMFAYSAFVGSSWQDHAIADIRAIFSHDDGETWSEDKLIIKCEDLSSNYMCVSFLRMNNGDIALYFGMRHTYENRKCTKLMVIRSSDEGQTWTKPEIAININEYLVIEKLGEIILMCFLHFVEAVNSLLPVAYKRMYKKSVESSLV